MRVRRTQVSDIPNWHLGQRSRWKHRVLFYFLEFVVERKSAIGRP
jgi:hypothetical protein